MNTNVLNARTALKTIAADMAEDMKAVEGKPFDARIVAEMFGNQAAAIASLAQILAEQLPEDDEPERDPVPYLDYLPDMDATEAGGLVPKPSAMPGSPAVAADVYEREDPELDDSPDDAEGYALHGAISDRGVTA